MAAGNNIYLFFNKIITKKEREREREHRKRKSAEGKNHKEKTEQNTSLFCGSDTMGNQSSSAPLFKDNDEKPEENEEQREEDEAEGQEEEEEEEEEAGEEVASPQLATKNTKQEQVQRQGTGGLWSWFSSGSTAPSANTVNDDEAVSTEEEEGEQEEEEEEEKDQNKEDEDKEAVPPESVQPLQTEHRSPESPGGSSSNDGANIPAGKVYNSHEEDGEMKKQPNQQQKVLLIFHAWGGG